MEANGARVVPLPRRAQASAVSRVLVDVARRVGGSLDLQRTLDQVTNAVVELLNFEVAVLNLAVADGSFEVVSVAGPPETKLLLLGTKQTRDNWQRLLAAGEPHGALRFVDHAHTALMDNMFTWVPELAVSDDPRAWHPLDSLFAPLHDADGDLLGVLSVDCPSDGLRPDAHQRELLELLAVQASLALDNARVHARLERNEQVFRAMFENAPVGMALFGRDRTIVQVNRAYCTFLGRTATDLLGCTAKDVCHPEDQEQTEQLALAVRECTGVVYKVDQRFLHSDGTTVWGRLSLTRLEGESHEEQVLAQVEDITAERLARAQLRARADTDALTGLLNRAALMDELDSALSDGGQVAVLFCDVDHFKNVNDTLGHAAGDALLVELGRHLQGVLRPGDSAGRLGGDEFILVLPHVLGSEAALAVAERVRAAASRLVTPEGTTLVTSLTIGVALSAPGSSARSLLAAADGALYRAKAAGRDRSFLA